MQFVFDERQVAQKGWFAKNIGSQVGTRPAKKKKDNNQKYQNIRTTEQRSLSKMGFSCPTASRGCDKGDKGREMEAGGEQPKTSNTSARAHGTSNPFPRARGGGGVLGTCYILALLWSVPQTGALTAMATVMFAQLATALVLDRIGAFGLPVQDITWQRLAGLGLVMSGLLLSRM